MFKLGIVQSLSEHFVGGFFVVVVEYEQLIDGNVELFERIELLLIVGEVYQNVPANFI